jgi:hypothetical protein
MSNQEVTKFEFLLTLGGNIVCQRYFNVKDHNPKTRRSMDMHYYVKEICENIEHDLKIKSSNYLCESQNSYYSNENSEENTDKNNDHFLLEIKIGEEVFVQRIFPAYLYHPKARYTVDIRPRLKKILYDLTEILSYSEVETTYLQYEL